MEREESCTQVFQSGNRGRMGVGEMGREVSLPPPITSIDIGSVAPPASCLLASSSLGRKVENEACHLQTRKVPETSSFVISTSFCQMWACKERPFVWRLGLIPLESVGGLGV